MSKSYGTNGDMETGAQPSFNNPHLSEAEYAALHGQGNEAIGAKVDETNDVDFTLKQGGNAAGTIQEQLNKVEIIEPAAKKEAEGGMGPFGNPVFVVGLFLLADIGKALFDPFVRGTLVNSGMQGIMVCVLNLVSALAITAAIHGKKGISQCMDKAMIIQYAAPAAFFAGSTLLSFIANKFLQGALKKILLQMRIPMTAFLASFITGATYTGLQWCCIALLVCTVVSFNFLQGGGAGAGGDKIVVGVFLLILQSFFAVMGSLVAEKFLKKKSSCPFNIQKFQIEAAQIGWSLLMGMFLSPLVNYGCDAIEGNINYDNYNKSTWWAYNSRFITWVESHQFEGKYDPTTGANKDKSLVNERNAVIGKLNKALGQDGYRLQALESVKPVDSTSALKARVASVKKDTGIKDAEAYFKREDAFFHRYRFAGKVEGVGADTLAKNFVLNWGVDDSNMVLTPSSAGAINQMSGLPKSYAFSAKVTDGVADGTTFFSMDNLWDDNNNELKSVQVATMKVNYKDNQTTITFETIDSEKKDKETKAPIAGSMSKTYVNEVTKSGSPVAKHTVTCDGVVPFATMEGNDQSTFKSQGNEAEGGAYVGKTLRNCSVNGAKATVYSYPGRVAAGMFDRKKTTGTCDYVQCDLTDREEEELSYMSFWFFIGHPTALKPYQYNKNESTGKVAAPTDAKSFYQWAEVDRPYKSWDLFAGFNSFPVIVAILMVSGQSWMSGLITKVVSSLGKNIVQAAATCTVVVLETMLIKTPEEALKTDWVKLLTGTLAVILTALLFSLLPKAPKKAAPKPEESKKPEEQALELSEPQVVAGKQVRNH